MSSPYQPETKRGTEETLEAIDRTAEWASRIDNSNDISGVNVGEFLEELYEEEDRIREKYRVKTMEISIDNFVFNQEEIVENILCGDLDKKVSAIRELQSYIENDFGRENPVSLSKEELMWIVAQEVKRNRKNNYGRDFYDKSSFEEIDFDSVGSRPDTWSEEFPIYNR